MSKDERSIQLAEKLGKAAGVKAFAGVNLELASQVSFGIPTGIPMLDLSLQRPGLPTGRITEIYGKEGVSKTTLAYSVMAQAQRMGGTALFIDTERSMEVDRARSCGVDTDSLILTEAETIEEVFSTIISMADQIDEASPTNPIVICVDSITGVEAKNNANKDLGEEAIPGLDAKVIKRGLRKINPLISDKNILLILINHAFHKMNVMSFAKQTEATGGLGPKYFASVRLELAQAGSIYDGGKGDERERLGMTTAIEVVKNKVAHNKKPKFKVEVTESGFDLYNGLWEGFIAIGGLTKETAQSYMFTPLDTKVTKKDFRILLDKEGGGIFEWYQFFLKAALKHDYLKAYKNV